MKSSATQKHHLLAPRPGPAMGARGHAYQPLADTPPPVCTICLRPLIAGDRFIYVGGTALDRVLQRVRVAHSESCALLWYAGHPDDT